MYSPEEIEKKRQIALQKRQARKEQNSQLPVNKPKNGDNLRNILPPQKRKNEFDTPSLSFKQSKHENERPNVIPSNNLSQISKSQNNNYSNSQLWNKNLDKTRPIKIENGQTLLTQSYNSKSTSSVSNENKKLVNTTEVEKFYNRASSIQGTCYMISESRFEINVPFYQPLIDFIKKYPSRSYNAQTKLWSFSITEYEKIMTEIKSNISNVSLVGIPNFVIKTFLKQKSSDSKDQEIDFSCIDKTLTNILMPFQKEGISYAIKKNGRCIIADDMGLGKTIQALAIAYYFKKDWPLLIVAPSSVRYQWSDTIYTYLPSIPVHQVYHFTKCKDYLEDAQITIVSYDILTRSLNTFTKKKFTTIILDESHVLKNPKAARTKAVQQLAFDALHILLLSGTPALSRPIELYTQISLITHSFMRFQEYGIRYCAGEKKSFGWDFSGASNIGELQLLLKAHCLLRRMKTDVLKQLPSKIREVVILDSELIPKKTKEMMKFDKKLETSKNQHSTILEYYNESAGQRLKAVCSYINDLLENEQKLIIFAHHVIVLDGISEILNKKRIKYIRIDGNTNSEIRKNNVDLFQTSDECLVAVLSITAANAGITLTAANLVVFAELYWNPGILTQAEDRVHRIGQNRASAGLNLDFSVNEAQITEQKQQNQIEKFLTKSPNEKTSVNNTIKDVDNVDKIFEDEEEFNIEDWDKFE
ncbi:SWI/SNF-related matrix-associated actin-dependent regulator of chromatin subfamily A-like protein 1 isoform X2 [Chelonus insularis]|uniref:SWI/SNF-related matrix-associated actin-dependent regulator of chromatin subfamily A-like protein 1 isoform X2 n=1 Tax=Chelonus insularis TaxID=460826 RepID=UPI00158A500F|nr:SWI/SNF-related matrix-associated actin-dependent regulator of chromatin subfamily A-like protein 1 isoform X2 [Chelonus insularis]